MSAFLLAFVCVLSVAFGQSNFVPFGSAQGDTLLTPCDDCSSDPIVFDFMFYGTAQTILYVNNNGLLSFSEPIGEYTPTGMSAANFPAIAPFWADVFTDEGDGTGSVWYGTRTDAATLTSLSAQISPTFQATHAFVATWDHVGYYARTDKVDTFQAVLVADDTGDSYVFFHYAELQWTTGDASGGQDGLGGTPACVGFSNGAGTYVQTPESLTPAVINSQDSLTQVSQSVIVLPPPPPVQVCGNGIVEGTEDCDGGSCCNADCTFSMTASCYCARQNLDSNQAISYFCAPSNGNQFYQCLQGAFASQSSVMNCAVGTACGCDVGSECSCEGYQSPCVTAGTQQVC